MKRTQSSHAETVRQLLQEAQSLLVSDRGRARALLSEAIGIANHHRDNVYRDRSQWIAIRSEVLALMAVLAEHDVNLDGALEWITDAYATLNDSASDSLVLDITTIYARLLMTRGVLDRSLELFHKARTMAIATSSSEVLGVVTANIATILFNTRHYTEAAEQFDSAASVFEGLGIVEKQAHALRGVGMTLSKRGMYEEALSIYASALNALELAGKGNAKERISIEESMGVDHLNLADVTHHQKHFRSAMKHFERCLELAEHHADNIHRAVAMRNIAQVLTEPYFKEADQQRARELFESALNIAENSGVKLLQSQILRELSLLYERSGDAERALQTFRSFYVCEREVLSAKAEEQIRSQEIRDAVQDSERKAEAQSVRADTLESELELHRKQLTSTTLAIGHKNAALRDARNELRELAPLADSTIASKLRRVMAQLEAAEHNEKYWDDLEEQLAVVHGAAMQTLAREHPTLTPTERKVCVLIRHNLSTKDIARLISAEPRSVEKYRQRIRKKLGLKETENLSNYLSRI